MGPACWFGKLGISTVVALLLIAPACLGDQIVLRGGGKVRGKVIPDSSRPDRVVVLLERGKTPLTIEKARITQIIPEPGPLDEYVHKQATVEPTAEAQYELGLWCERQKLPDLAALHYEAAVARDKSFGPAHQKLGHILLGERWLTPDEYREAQGLVRHKGKWITAEERDQREKQRAEAAEQLSWQRRVRLLRQAVAFGPDDRRRQAEAQLLDIRDPIAVGALIRVLGDDTDEFRALLDRALGAIPGAEASSALARRILHESDPDVQQGTLEQVLARPESEVLPLLIKALKASNPLLVNRAAWTIGHLGAVSAVPRLVPALLTTQYRVVWAGGSSVPPGFSASFGSVSPGPGVPLAPIASNGYSYAYLTPPVVGPGSVAYGAVSAPALSGAGLSLGGGSRGPVPRVVPYTYQNVEVLAALVRLTGQDFGYDPDAWRHWLKTSYRPDPAPVRRVPQP